MAAAIRSAAASRSSSVAAPGWKHTAPTPSAVERSSLGSIHEGQKLGYELERDQRSGKMSAGQLQSA